MGDAGKVTRRVITFAVPAFIGFISSVRGGVPPSEQLSELELRKRLIRLDARLAGYHTLVHQATFPGTPLEAVPWLSPALAELPSKPEFEAFLRREGIIR